MEKGQDKRGVFKIKNPPGGYQQERRFSELALPPLVLTNCSFISGCTLYITSDLDQDLIMLGRVS